MRDPVRLPASVLAVLLVLVLTGCGNARAETRRLVLTSTTSTQDSGLFDVLIPAFERAHPEFEVEVVAVGTGAAIEMGEKGDADVLLVHAEQAEEEFVSAGFGVERRDVMYNDFVIVGLRDDPANVAGLTDAAGALARIAGAGAEFVSRGDESGTHKKETALWEASGVEPVGDWYVSAGQGMGDVLTMASERRAYTLTDRATYLKMSDGLDLVVLVEGDPVLRNQYGVVPVSGAADAQAAAAFTDWVTGPEAQALIAEYGVEEFGRPLFVPNAS